MRSWAEQKLSGALDREPLLSGHPRLDGHQRKQLIDALRTRLPENRILFEDDTLIPYSYDATGERHRPDVVVIPQTREEVVTTVKTAREYGSYLIGRGSATNLSGGTMPIVGGTIISLTQMKRILRIDYANRIAVVEPGVVNGMLQDILNPQHFFFPPDPSSHRIATLGGNVAENSGGVHCIKYGVTTNHVIDMVVVTSQGDVVRLPVTRDWRTGYDLTGLVTGSEGTMGLITELTLAISPLPEETQTMLAVFSSVPAALRCVSAIIAAKVIPATLELLDKVSVEIVEAYVHAGYPVGADAILLIEVDGSRSAVEEQTHIVREIAQTQGAMEFRLATTKTEAESLWRGRRAHYGAVARIAPHLWVQDVTVPRPHLADMMNEVLAIGQRYQFPILTVAHAGDGNLHPTIPYDPGNAQEVARMREADHEILQAAVRYGGAITGEHGIGIDKVENLSLMYDQPELQRMMALKEVFDPHRRLNPFKAIPFPAQPLTEGLTLTSTTRHQTAISQIAPTSVTEVQEAVAWARESQHSVRIQGGGHRTRLAPTQPAVVLSTVRLAEMVDFDPDNLTCEVEAGMSTVTLAQQLEAAGLELAGIEPFMTETIGGLVAANARFWRSSLGLGWRDLVTGVEWIDGRGQVLRFGRKTMKNVAGYDVSKLAVGSWGTLGVITKVTLRLKPRLSPRLIGIATGLLPTLLQRAISLGGLSPRPQGVLVEHCGQESRLIVLVQGHEGPEIQSRVAEIEPSMHWSDDPALWQVIEQGRIQKFYQSLAEGSYQEGGGLPTELLTIADLVPTRVNANFFPGSGSYEVYGEAGVALPGVKKRLTQSLLMVTADESLAHLEEGIRRVFDPAHVFVS
ncbi:MAG: FAD-binding oxidoreductase [Firmicutes bacterium]|nr:FAD-binding oxidoreductase [Bacillota bacterium]